MPQRPLSGKNLRQPSHLGLIIVATSSSTSITIGGFASPISLSNLVGINGLHAYVELERLSFQALESHLVRDYCQPEDLSNTLMQYWKCFIQSRSRLDEDKYCLSALWHSAFICLHADIYRLEQVIGREGAETATAQKSYAVSWASSQNGQRCALHAAMILREVTNMRVGVEPPIHFARVVFRAALAWFCYAEFRNSASDSRQHDLNFPELEILGVDCRKLLFEANGYRNTQPPPAGSGVFRGLIDILHKLGREGIGKRYADILTLLVQEQQDSDNDVQ